LVFLFIRDFRIGIIFRDSQFFKNFSQRMAEIGVEAIERLAKDLRVPRHLAEFGVEENDISGLAEGAMKVTRLLANNPRIMTLEDAKEIYRAAL
jgi:alcohol dehydrogenase class IV